MHKPTREGWIIISMTVVLLGVMFLFVFFVSSLADYACDGCLGKPLHSGLKELAAAVSAILLVFIGILIGVVAWLLILRPFYSRDEIEPYMQCPPGIPFVTKFAEVFKRLTFDIIFPHPKN